MSKKYNRKFWKEFDRDYKKFNLNIDLMIEKYGEDAVNEGRNLFRKNDYIGNIIFFITIPFQTIPYVLIFLQLITYAMCIVKWFLVDHYSFWHGLKEFIWTLLPIINFTYVWDWWFVAFAFIISNIIIFFDQYFK